MTSFELGILKFFPLYQYLTKRESEEPTGTRSNERNSRRKATENNQRICSIPRGESRKITHNKHGGPGVKNFLAWMINLDTVKQELSNRYISTFRYSSLSQKDFLKAIDGLPYLSVDIKYVIVRTLLKSSRREFDNKKYNNNEVQKEFLDIFYEQLKAKITLIDKNSKRYELIKMYVKNTHSRYHDGYEIQVNYVFDIYRYEDRKRFNQNIGNKKLLWHGTTISNVVSILQNGLQLNPDTQTVHRNPMFGRGIYFTNTVSKAANYCGTVINTRPDYGVLFLCEVALGNVKKCIQAVPDLRLPDGMNSVFAVGQLAPNNKYVRMIYPDVQVPCGKLIEDPSNRNNPLRHDEFVVYDPKQIIIRYAVSISFKYN